MSTAQIVFSMALAVISAIIVAFAIFVLSSTVWGNRWVRPGQAAASKSESASKKKGAA